MYIISFNPLNTVTYLSILFFKPNWLSVLTLKLQKYSQHKDMNQFYKFIKTCILKKESKQRQPMDGKMDQ